MITGKTIALSRWTFVGKVMSLLFNTLSRFVIAFLPRSKRLLISWLQLMSAVILEGPPNIVGAWLQLAFAPPFPSIWACSQVFLSLGWKQRSPALCTRWPKYWSLSFSISPFNKYSVLISFRIDWLDLLGVQETVKSLHHSLKASVLWHSAFFMVQLSHPFMTTGKTKALTRWTSLAKQCLCFLKHC